MTVTIEYWTTDNKTYYGEKIVKKINGTNAADCMQQVTEMRMNHDCILHTPIEIVNIED